MVVNESSDALRTYLSDIRAIPQLTAAQEIEIGLQAISGNQEAIQKLTEHNLKLVVSIAKRYASPPAIPLIDVIQAGNEGLMKAAKKYNPRLINPQTEQPYRFSTYAVRWIRQACGAYIAEHGKTIKVPEYILEQIVEIKKVMVFLRTQLNRNATLEEIAEEMNERRALRKDERIKDNPLTSERIAELLGYLEQPYSLESHDMARDDFALEDCIYDESAAQELEDVHDTTKVIIEKALQFLSERQRKVLILRLGLFGHEEHTLERLVPIVGVTRERIRQIEVGAYKRLHSPYVQEQLRAIM